MDGTDLYEIERSLWTNDPSIYSHSLRDDALLAFPETGVITPDTAVAAIREENREDCRWAEVTFSDERALSPTDDTRVLIYKPPHAGTASRTQSRPCAAASTPCTPVNGSSFSTSKRPLPPDSCCTDRSARHDVRGPTSNPVELLQLGASAGRPSSRGARPRLPGYDRAPRLWDKRSSLAATFRKCLT